jgi:internalin A
LVKLNRLKFLSLQCSDLDTEGLRQLDRLAELEVLSITVKPDSIEGLSFVANLPKLRQFYSDDGITDTGFAWIARCNKLEQITIIAPTLTDAGLKHLANSESLKELQVLSASKITDSGLAHLGSQTNLTSIDIRGTPMTEIGLTHLCKLPRLEMLAVSPGKLSKSAIESYFEKAKPELKVQVVPW